MSDQFTFDIMLMKLKHLQEAIDNAREVIKKTHTLMAFVEKVIRDHEDEDGCIGHSS